MFPKKQVCIELQNSNFFHFSSTGLDGQKKLTKKQTKSWTLSKLYQKLTALTSNSSTSDKKFSIPDKKIKKNTTKKNEKKRQIASKHKSMTDVY